MMYIGVLGSEKARKEQPDRHLTLPPSLKKRRMAKRAKTAERGRCGSNRQRCGSEFNAKGSPEKIWKEQQRLKTEATGGGIKTEEKRIRKAQRLAEQSEERRKRAHTEKHRASKEPGRQQRGQMKE